MPEPTEIETKVFWWRSEEGKIFWIYSDNIGNDEYPWWMGSADPDHCYIDFVQLNLTRDKTEGRISPVGLDDCAVELALKRFVTEDTRAKYEYEDAVVTVGIVKVNHLGHLRRIMHEFDAVSLVNTSSGRSFMGYLTGNTEG